MLNNWVSQATQPQGEAVSFGSSGRLRNETFSKQSSNQHPKASNDLGSSSTTIHTILKRNFLYPHHDTPVQELILPKFLARVEFSSWFLENNISHSVLWTDEGIFARTKGVDFHNTLDGSPKILITQGHLCSNNNFPLMYGLRSWGRYCRAVFFPHWQDIEAFWEFVNNSRVTSCNKKKYLVPNERMASPLLEWCEELIGPEPPWEKKRAKRCCGLARTLFNPYLSRLWHYSEYSRWIDGVNRCHIRLRRRKSWVIDESKMEAILNHFIMYLCN